MAITKKRIKIVKHGYSYKPIYRVYSGIVSRCYDTSNIAYKDYGGRGILLCEEWADSPKSFCEWAEQNGYKKGLFIDRIDVNKGYSPSNCRFVTPTESNRNTRKTKLTPKSVSRMKRLFIDGASLVQLAEYFDVSRAAVGAVMNGGNWGEIKPERPGNTCCHDSGNIRPNYGRAVKGRQF